MPIVKEPLPQHGKSLHVEPLVLCVVLADREHGEEVRGDRAVHLGDGTGLGRRAEKKKGVSGCGLLEQQGTGLQGAWPG